MNPPGSVDSVLVAFGDDAGDRGALVVEVSFEDAAKARIEEVMHRTGDRHVEAASTRGSFTLPTLRRHEEGAAGSTIAHSRIFIGFCLTTALSFQWGTR